MIHHVLVGTIDAGRARTCYDAVLPVVGLWPVGAADTSLDHRSCVLVLSVQTPIDGQRATVGNGSHIAVAAEDRATVDRFYRAALALGGTDVGQPGLRPQYDARFHSAFVRDPDGNKLEAVTYSAV